MGERDEIGFGIDLPLTVVEYLVIFVEQPGGIAFFRQRPDADLDKAATCASAFIAQRFE